MIQLIVITASVLLGMFLYPIVKRTYARFIAEQYRKLEGEIPLSQKKRQKKEKQQKKREENPVKMVLKQEEKPPIIGKSKFTLSQSKPNTATALETENREEKEPIFVPATDEESPLMDVHIPLEKVEKKDTGIDFKEEEEELEEMIEPGAALAGGFVFDDLVKTKEVIERTNATVEEEQAAGKVLSENRDTVLVGQMMEGSAELAARISHLIDMQDKALAAEKEARLSKRERKKLDAEDFKNFDVSSIF